MSRDSRVSSPTLGGFDVGTFSFLANCKGVPCKKTVHNEAQVLLKTLHT
jgi:hypothetical protein